MEPFKSDEMPPTTTQGEHRDAMAALLTANNLGVAWSLCLGFGGAIIILYFRANHFFPEFDWKESFSYLAALSFLGGIIAVLYGLLLFVPGLIWSESLLHDFYLESRMCRLEGGHRVMCWKTAWLTMGVPFLVFMVVVHWVATRNLGRALAIDLSTLAVVSAIVGVVFAGRPQSHAGAAEPKSSATGGGGRDGGNEARSSEAVIPSQTESTDGSSHYWSKLVKFVTLFFVSGFASLVAMLLLYALVLPSPYDAPPENWNWMRVICTGVVVTTNLLVASQFHTRKHMSIATAVLATLILLGTPEVLARRGEALSFRLMREFGFGGTVSTVVFTPEAAGILKAQGFAVSDSVPTLTEARILSRLGRNVLVACQKRRVTIPREMVISWSEFESTTR